MTETDDPGAEWRTRLDELLDANEGTDRPATVSDLARELAALPESTQNVESWRTWLKRIRRTGVGSEANIVMLASVLRTPRRSLPPTREPLTKEALGRRLRSLESDHDELREEFDAFVQGVLERLAGLEGGQGFREHG